MLPNDDLGAELSSPDMSLLGYTPLNMSTDNDDYDHSADSSCEQLLDAAMCRLDSVAEQLIDKLHTAVHRRVGQHSYYCDTCHRHQQTCSDAHVSVMFSGGIDSVMLAYLAHQCVPQNQPIDLLNVAFEVGSASNYDVPDRITGRQALQELPQNRRWNFVEVSITLSYLRFFIHTYAV